LDASAFGVICGPVLDFGGGGPVVPHVQGGIGVLNHGGDVHEDSQAALILPQLGAGVRLMVGESASINCGAFWQHLSNAEGVEDLSASQSGIGMGTSVLF